MTNPLIIDSPEGRLAGLEAALSELRDQVLRLGVDGFVAASATGVPDAISPFLDFFQSDEFLRIYGYRVMLTEDGQLKTSNS